MTSLADAGSWDWQQGSFDRRALKRNEGATEAVIQLHPTAGRAGERLSFHSVTSQPFSCPLVLQSECFSTASQPAAL